MSDAVRALSARTIIIAVLAVLTCMTLAPVRAHAFTLPSQQQIAIAAAKTKLGMAYLSSSGSAPIVALDCSGLTTWAYAQAGITLVHHAGTQWKNAYPNRMASLGPVQNPWPLGDKASLKPGDLLFFWDSSKQNTKIYNIVPQTDITHVGLFIGGTGADADLFIESTAGGGVAYAHLNKNTLENQRYYDHKRVV